MNLAVSTNLDSISPGVLPPERGETRARVLFLSEQTLGLTTYGRRLEEIAAIRDDLACVHVRVTSRWPARALWARVPGLSPGASLAPLRYRLAWRRIVRRWLTGPLRDRFDVVHAMGPGLGLGVLDLPAPPRPKLVVCGDGTSFCTARDFYPDRPAWRNRPFFEQDRRLYSRADLVAKWSRWAADSAIRDGGASPERVTVVPPCVYVKDRNPRRERARPGGPVRIVFVGGDWVRKGGPLLLDWHQRLWKDRVELHVVSAGATPDRSLPGVVWHGRVDNKTLVDDLLPSMDLAVLPTQSDHSGVGIVEALSCGVPAISSAVGGVGELIDEDRTGHVLRPDDHSGFIAAVERLLALPELREAMSDAAHATALRRFHAPAVLGAHLARVAALAGR